VNALGFLGRAEVDQLHAQSLALYGGLNGVRDAHTLDSAIARAQTFACYQENVDAFDVAAVYAYSISQGQCYLDGNKRTAVLAALTFLETNGFDTDPIPDMEIYNTLIAIAERRAMQSDMAALLRKYCTLG